MFSSSIEPNLFWKQNKNAKNNVTGVWREKKKDLINGHNTDSTILEKDQIQISSIASSSSSSLRMKLTTLSLSFSFSFPASHCVLSKSFYWFYQQWFDYIGFGWNSFSLSLTHTLLSFPFQSASQNWNNHYRIVYTILSYVHLCIHKHILNSILCPKNFCVLNWPITRYGLRCVQMLLLFVSWWLVLYREACSSIFFSFCHTYLRLCFSHSLSSLVVFIQPLSVFLFSLLPCSRNHATSLPFGFFARALSLSLCRSFSFLLFSLCVCF